MGARHVLLLVVLGVVLGCALAKEATHNETLPFRPGRPFQADRERARAARGGKNVTEKLGAYPGVFGVDFAIWTVPSADQWHCMRDTGNYRFAVIEAFNGGRGVNTKMGEISKAAFDHNFERVDLYSFMCPKCGNSVSSARDLIKSAKDQGTKFDTVWLDIEQCTGCWGTDSENRDFIRSLLDEYKKEGVKVGIYTSTGEWPAVTGGTDEFKAERIWYAHYDGNPSFSDWSNFGGWTKPDMKQFADSAGNTCGTSVDRDWHPDHKSA